MRAPSASDALEVYTAAFGATEDFRRKDNGKLLLVVLVIGDSRIVISDQQNEPQKTSGGDPRGGGPDLKIYVDDVEEVFRRAIRCGATEQEALENKYWGERSGSIVDPFGFTWILAEFLEDVPHEEIERRMRKEAGK